MLREAFVQPGIDSVVSDQLVVCAAFDDSAVVEHDDLIGVADIARADTPAVATNELPALTMAPDFATLTFATAFRMSRPFSVC